HAMDDRDIADLYWKGCTDRAFPMRSFVDAGVRIALGSDAPVAPLDPWVAIAAAVTRSRDGREPWHPEQAMGVRDALTASTRGGQLAPRTGDIADLVIVERDPLVASPDDL